MTSVDFALGTDCGGSVRLPASYCGIYGIRTSHGLVPTDGVVNLAPSFDTVGWFAREASLMRRVAEVLLRPAPALIPRRLVIATDTDPGAAPILRHPTPRVPAGLPEAPGLRGP
jgi:amidase